MRHEMLAVIESFFLSLAFFFVRDTCELVKCSTLKYNRKGWHNKLERVSNVYFISHTIGFDSTYFL